MPYPFHASNPVPYSRTQTCFTPHQSTCPFCSHLYFNIKRVCNFSLECLAEMTPIQMLMGTWLISAVKCREGREGEEEKKMERMLR
jgi:hypothetical protein